MSNGTTLLASRKYANATQYVGTQGVARRVSLVEETKESASDH